MRLPASEKLEIISLVEQSHLPARRTLQTLGVKPSPGRAAQSVRCHRQNRLPAPA